MALQGVVCGQGLEPAAHSVCTPCRQRQLGPAGSASLGAFSVTPSKPDSPCAVPGSLWGELAKCLMKSHPGRDAFWRQAALGKRILPGPPGRRCRLSETVRSSKDGFSDSV